MFILTYAVLYDSTPAVTVCTGRLVDAVHLFDLLIEMPTMQFVEIIDRHGVMRREWDCETKGIRKES